MSQSDPHGTGHQTQGAKLFPSHSLKKTSKDFSPSTKHQNTNVILVLHVLEKYEKSEIEEKNTYCRSPSSTSNQIYQDLFDEEELILNLIDNENSFLDFSDEGDTYQELGASDEEGSSIESSDEEDTYQEPNSFDGESSFLDLSDEEEIYQELGSCDEEDLSLDSDLFGGEDTHLGLTSESSLGLLDEQMSFQDADSSSDSFQDSPDEECHSPGFNLRKCSPRKLI